MTLYRLAREAHKGFNSTLVRLKAVVDAVAINWQEVGFNSTLVRLKGSPSVFQQLGGSLFQFHSGAVKGVSWFGGVQDAGRFQFHSGAVKGWSIRRSSECRKRVSIPLWCG